MNSNERDYFPWERASNQTMLFEKTDFETDFLEQIILNK